MIHGKWQKNKVKFKLETTEWPKVVTICVHENNEGSGSSKCLDIPKKQFKQMINDIIKLEGV